MAVRINIPHGPNLPSEPSLPQSGIHSKAGRTYFSCFTTLPITILIGLFYLIFPQKAYAYLDPGSLSYLLQLFIAALIGASFAIKTFWIRIKAFFGNFLSKKQRDKN